MHFQKAYYLSNNTGQILSFDPIYHDIQRNQQHLKKQYNNELILLASELEALSLELRTAVIIATLSRVEASKAGNQYKDSLINVADNVESSALSIKRLINESKQLAEGLSI